MITPLARAFAFALLFPAANAIAARPLAIPAPDFPKGLTWINSPELSLRGLKDRNVMVAVFISLSSSNSLRVLSRLEAWSKRYARAGLLVVAIQTPDFDFEKDPALVRAELQRLGVSVPVVLDNDRALWKAYQAQGWPSFFLVDPKGAIIFDRLGEGRAQEFETEIIGALERFNGYSPKEYWPAPDPLETDCGKATAVSYLGSARGHAKALSVETGRSLIASRDGELVYKGKWNQSPDSLRSRHASHEGSDFLRLIYRGVASMLLAHSAGAKPVPLYVKQDDFWLTGKNAGKDVRFDKDHRSFVVVAGTRFYNVTRNAADEVHELMFYPALPGLEVYAFDFNNACQDRAGH